MAEPGELPLNPLGTLVAPVYGSETGHSAAGKRRREEYSPGVMSPVGDGDETASKRRVKGQDVLFRIVVPSRQIGKVIGKEGCRIQKIREESKATIKIADAVARHEERVVIVNSKDSDNSVSDAENALQQIASLILKEDDSTAEASKVGAGHVAANTIRLLIAGSQAGSLIGMSGQNIEKLRNSSGASITVLAQNQLPLCASAHESDRVVQALEEIGCQLRPTNLAADYVTFEMVISETLVGGLIGRCGSNISRIRNESGATIKVYGGKGEQNQRQIQFGGSIQQVALAKQRVDEYIYSQLIQPAGAQQASNNTETMKGGPKNLDHEFKGI
ncbi:hypothetical protein G4B88_003279 [Cannabis sativa]|uniref:K Homology domain-containing protein n=1 Tax=Cannabis sativa TaxID=3483 RepID=A0A7J6I5S2_CANSA|nr:hypothetical protein G4B88_003279 [Cannabis sativa]